MIMEWAAWVASALVFWSFFMKTMIPLRTIAIVSNVAFIVYALLGLHYGIFEKVAPILALHLALLPLNILRLYQMKKLVRQIRQLSIGEVAWESLIPYMRKEAFAAGTTIFRKGDVAEKIYFLHEGHIVIPELKKKLQEGDLFGEVGIFAAVGTRSASALCTRAAVVYSIHRDEVIRLYCQDPLFGLLIVRMHSLYVAEDVDTIVKIQNGEAREGA